MEYSIEARSLTKVFQGFKAVDGIDFSVCRGEIFGFLGPNGAGKTTTIRMLTGILIPDGGKAVIEGVDIAQDPVRAKACMGVIPEVGNVYLDMSALQNILLAGKFYGMHRAAMRDRAQNLLQMLGLEKKGRQTVKTFSKGQKQRASIAAAIVHEPKVLFLDEPTAGLDVESQRLIRKLVKDMNSRGTTIFLTTHNIEEANMLCDRVCIINKGRIVATDKPEALKSVIEKTKSVEVSFRQKVSQAAVAHLGPVTRVEVHGDKLRLYTADPDRVVKAIVRFAEQKNLTMLAVHIRQPSLEDAFMELVGGQT